MDRGRHCYVPLSHIQSHAFLSYDPTCLTRSTSVPSFGIAFCRYELRQYHPIRPNTAKSSATRQNRYQNVQLFFPLCFTFCSMSASFYLRHILWAAIVKLCGGLLRVPTLRLASKQTLDIQNHEFAENVRRALYMICCPLKLRQWRLRVRPRKECVRENSCLP